MEEQSRPSIRISTTIYKDTNEELYALLNETTHNRPEVLRRLIDFAISQFPKKTLNAQNILNGSFYYCCNNQNTAHHLTKMSKENEHEENNNSGKIASKINF